LYLSKAIRWKDRIFEMPDRTALAGIAGPGIPKQRSRALHLKLRLCCDIGSAWTPPLHQRVSNTFESRSLEHAVMPIATPPK
jgi:hypothetical protein